MMIDLEAKILEQFPLRITAGALEKANIYARLARRDSSPVEIYMHLLGTDGVIDDVLLSHEQVVGPSWCQPSPDGLALTYALVKEKKTNILGWCHSHGLYDTFFSEKDRHNVLPFSGQGGWVTSLDGESLELFYNIVVNAANDPPYGVLAYHHGDTWALIEPVQVHVVESGVHSACSERVAQEELAKVLSCHGVSAEVRQRLDSPRHKDVLALLSPSIGRCGYRATLQKEMCHYQRNANSYSSGFGELLKVLSGDIVKSWIYRAESLVRYYITHTSTQQERSALEAILSSSTYLRREHPHLLSLMKIFIGTERVHNSTEGEHASPQADPGMGETEAESH